jgi:hypothetical protein
MATEPTGSRRPGRRVDRPLLDDWIVQPFGTLDSAQAPIAVTGLRAEPNPPRRPSLAAIVERLRRLVALASDNPHGGIAAVNREILARKRSSTARRALDATGAQAPGSGPPDAVLCALVESIPPRVQGTSVVQTRRPTKPRAPAALLAGLAVLGLVLIASR